jgi:hypothetical protein
VSQNRDNMMDPAPDIRDAIDKLTTELKLTRIAFAAMREELEGMIARDGAEFSPGYTTVRREITDGELQCTADH